jgi:diphthamide synthase (EF-2-diphthine--ammonia ligase)
MDILFWSGGKDSYLALEYYREAIPHQKLKLLTTYDAKTESARQQRIPLKSITKQADALRFAFIPVALPTTCPNEVYLNRIREALNNQPEKIANLIFGDWNLQDIRDWKEEQFKKLGFSCRFPIWKREQGELLTKLFSKPVEIRISAVAKKYRDCITPGEVFDAQFVRRLPESIDKMGERGEFHTEVIFKSIGKVTATKKV